MTQESKPPFTREALEQMNKKSIENQFFTPDRVYIDLALFKDFNIGAVYADAFSAGPDRFREVQSEFMKVVKDYQIRTYDTSDPYLASLGYSDDKIDAILSDVSHHTQIFLLSPATGFLHYLIRHTIRNQNHSSPAGKHQKRPSGKGQYTLEATPVDYYINTYPLTLPSAVLEPMARELGESLRVNIHFLNKDPGLFNKKDWSTWMEKIDCFYLHSLGRFTAGQMVYDKQGQMVFSGIYLFARKRFEKHVMQQMQSYDFAQQIAVLTAQIDVMYDFEWIPNKDLLLLPDPVLPDEGGSLPETE